MMVSRDSEPKKEQELKGEKVDDYILGIDIGTSSVKVGLLDLSTQKLKNLSSMEYDSSSEQNPEVIWTATLEVLKTISRQIKNNIKLRAIGFSGQMHGTVLYGSNNKVIAPIINWKDKRCNTPLKKYNGDTTIGKIENIIGEDSYRDLGIDRMASGFMGATLFYIKENDRKLFNKIKHVLLPTDFIRKRITAENGYITDRTNAFSTGLFNVNLNSWHYRFIEKLGLPIDIFPEVKKTTDIVGYTSPAINKLLGLKNNIAVIVGGGDNQLSALGSGLYGFPSPILINIGTGAQISKVIDRYEKIEGLDTRSFFNEMFLLTGASLGGGGNYKLLKENLNSKTKNNISFKELDELTEKIEPGSDGLRYCTGPSRKNPERKAGFFGSIGLKKSPGHMARSVMEGVLFDLYEFYKLMGKNSEDILIGSGNGLSKSKVWSQIASDMFDLKLRITDFENAVFGAALMAAKGINRISDFNQTFESIEYFNIVPIQRNSKKYNRLLKGWENYKQ